MQKLENCDLTKAKKIATTISTTELRIIFSKLNCAANMMSEDVTMMDYTSSSYPLVDTTSTMCENECEKWKKNKQLSLPFDSTALSTRSMPSSYGPGEMEGALRIMNHAGRILWRAAMEAIPVSGRSYNPPLRVLTKLFQRSFGKNDDKTCAQTKTSLLSFGIRKASVPEEDDLDEIMEPTPETTVDCVDLYDSQPKKRKTVSALLSFLPSVVSDSEGEEDEIARPSKRARRNSQEESVAQQYWY